MSRRLGLIRSHVAYCEEELKSCYEPLSGDHQRTLRLNLQMARDSLNAAHVESDTINNEVAAAKARQAAAISAAKALEVQHGGDVGASGGGGGGGGEGGEEEEEGGGGGGESYHGLYTDDYLPHFDVDSISMGEWRQVSGAVYGATKRRQLLHAKGEMFHRQMTSGPPHNTSFAAGVLEYSCWLLRNWQVSVQKIYPIFDVMLLIDFK